MLFVNLLFILWYSDTGRDRSYHADQKGPERGDGEAKTGKGQSRNIRCLWPFTGKRTLTTFRFQTEFCFQAVWKQFKRNLHPFERLIHPFGGNVQPFEWLGHPFDKNIHPFERLGACSFGINPE